MLGALPWLVANLRHDWFSFSFAPGGGTYLSRFRGFFTATLPMILDLRVPFSLDWALGPVLSGLLLVAALGWVAYLALRRRDRLGPLLAVTLAFPFLYAASSFTWLVEEPRYLVLLLPVLALLLSEGMRRPRVAAVGLAAACVALGRPDWRAWRTRRGTRRGRGWWTSRTTSGRSWTRSRGAATAPWWRTTGSPSGSRSRAGSASWPTRTAIRSSPHGWRRARARPTSSWPAPLRRSASGRASWPSGYARMPVDGFVLYSR